MKISRSIHVAANDIISFLFKGLVIFYSIYEPYLLCPFLCQWTSRLLSCLGYVNTTAINIGMPVSFQIMFFSGCIPRSGIARGPIVNCIVLTNRYTFDTSLLSTSLSKSSFMSSASQFTATTERQTSVLIFFTIGCV